jgi:DNA-binding transcriptional LysR family regulator
VAVNHQHLRAFHAIACEGGVSRAARRLNVAQPTLSQQLKALEERHQAVLFDGRTPPLKLTALGRELFALTQRLFTASEVIDELLGDDPSQRLSAVRFGSDSPIYGARMAAKLRERHPDLGIEVRIGNARETLQWLDDAKVDAAIVSDPPGDNQYAYMPLFADWFMVAMPADHPRARDSVFPLAALTQSRLLVREPTSRTRVSTEQLLARAQIIPQDVIQLHTRDTIREGVALGLGVSLFVSSECPPDFRISYVPLERPPEVSSHGLAGFVVCLAERKRTRLMRSIMAITEELGRLSPLPLGPTHGAANAARADQGAAGDGDARGARRRLRRGAAPRPGEAL